MRDDVAAYHANRMHVGESIGVVAALPGSFVHEGADRIVRQHQAPELLTCQLGRFAAQHNPRAAQVGLQLVERRFDDIELRFLTDYAEELGLPPP